MQKRSNLNGIELKLLARCLRVYGDCSRDGGAAPSARTTSANAAAEADAGMCRTATSLSRFDLEKAGPTQATTRRSV